MDEASQFYEEKSNSKLPAGEIDDVNSEVVPSVDSDKNSPDWDLPAKIAKLRGNVQKRKRPRRKSKKRKRPYTKTSWQQRRQLKSSERAQRVRQQMFANGQPVAPYNTTQFLIEDHGDLQNIDAQLQVVKDPGNSVFTNKPSRARDSSFSVDSDEDYFYSSPEDEEEFLTKEFSNAYEDLHVERLSSMSKSEIIHDYLQLEAKYEKAIIELKRLKKGIKEEPDDLAEANKGEHQKREEHDGDTDTSSKSENELAELLRNSQLENMSLKIELEELQEEIKTLQNLIEKNQSSSVDSESDSSCTSSISSDSSSTSSISSDSSSCESDSDEERKSVNLTRTQSCNVENNTEHNNFSNINGVNGNLSLSEDDGSENDKQEVDK